MAKLSNKENLLLVLRKEIPEEIPTYNVFWGMQAMPSCFMGGRNQDGTGKDFFGVEWVIDNSAFQAALPKPGDFILDDIRKWRDVIKAPDFTGLDWAEMAKKDLENHDPEIPLAGSTQPGIGFFQSMMSFMGFTEGLAACYEEPEEAKALIEYLTDWSVELAKLHVTHYKLDYMWFCDDIAHERDPFVSLPLFREIFAPAWRRLAAVYLEAGIPVAHHNCGHFELFAPDLADMGVTLWEPVQNSNDVKKLKETLGRNLALAGAVDFNKFADPEYPATEEEIRAEVKAQLDVLAKDAGFAWMGGIFAFDEVSQKRNEIIMDEFEKLRGTYYK